MDGDPFQRTESPLPIKEKRFSRKGSPTFHNDPPTPPPGTIDSNNNINHEGPSTPTEKWDRVRRHFLPAHKVWPYPVPGQSSLSNSTASIVNNNSSSSGSSNINHHVSRSSSTGRSSPRHWDHGVSKFGARVFRAKPPVKLSEAQRFNDELFMALESSRSNKQNNSNNNNAASFRTLRQRYRTSSHMDLLTLQSSDATSTGTGPASTWTSGSGSASPPISQQQQQQQQLNNTSNNNESLQKIAIVIDRFKHCRNLPSATYQLVLSELSFPFRDVNANPLSCNQAFDIFEKICTEFQCTSEDESLQRWLWCCQAMHADVAEIMDRGSRLLLTLVIPPTEIGGYEFSYPSSYLALQSFFSALCSLYYSLDINTSSQSSQANKNIVLSLMKRLSMGQIVQDDQDIVDPKFRCIEAMLKLIVVSESSLAKFLFESLVEQFWIPPHIVSTKLYTQLLILFAEASISTLSSEPICKTNNPDWQFSCRPCIFNFIQDHFNYPLLLNSEPETRKGIIIAILSIFTNVSIEHYTMQDPETPFTQSASILQNATELLCTISKDRTYEKPLIGAIEYILESPDLEKLILPCISAVTLGMPDQVASKNTSLLVPKLFYHLANNPPEESSLELRQLLCLLQSQSPQAFYKSLFACATAEKKETILLHLREIVIISILIGRENYFFYDAEMFTVALLADVGPKDSATGNSNWSKLRLGQLIVLINLALALEDARLNYDEEHTYSRSAKSFVGSLEPRLSVFLKAREQDRLVPIAHRHLLSCLLFEMRMLTKSSRAPGYMSRIVRWTSCVPGTTTFLDKKESKAGNIFLSDEEKKEEIEITQDMIMEAEYTLATIQEVYNEFQSLLNGHRRMSISESEALTRLPEDSELKSDMVKWIDKSCRYMEVNAGTFGSPFLTLLVALHDKISFDDLRKLFPIIWKYLFNEINHAKVVRPASFLVMLCAEKVPDTLQIISYELDSNDSEVKKNCMGKLSLLFALRASIMGQYFASKSRPRPFRPPDLNSNLIVPADFGTTEFIWTAPDETNSNKPGAHLPIEVRRALIELGWDDGAAQKTTSERQRFPVSSVPSNEINRQGEGASSDASFSLPNSSTSRPSSPDVLKILNSATFQKTSKHVTILSHAILEKMMKLINLTHDPDMFVSSMAAEAVFTFIRDDTGPVARALAKDLTGKLKDQQNIVSTFNSLSLFRQPIPPEFAHFVFNQLVGICRDQGKLDLSSYTLQICALVLPLVARYSSYVNEFSLRDIKKNKLEYLILPSASLFFQDPSPPSFPRNSRELYQRPQSSSHQRLKVAPSVIELITIRSAQSLLMSNFLDLNPKDAYLIKKTIDKFVLLIDTNFQVVGKTEDMVPRSCEEVASTRMKSNHQRQDMTSASLLLARSWLFYSVKLVSGLSRYFSDTVELKRILEGMVTILYAHGDDLCVISHSVKLCMICSSRFRRIFMSATDGFSYFLPILFKCFVEARDNPAIRQSIIYAFSRFYFVHEDNFVFQLFSSIHPVVFNQYCSSELKREFFECLTTILIGLSKPQDMALDMAGTVGVSNKEEKDAVITEVVEKPHHFFGTKDASSRMDQIRPALSLDRPKLFSIEDSIRLLFTALAYNPNSSGAQHFLSYLIALVPHFWDVGNTCKALLQDSIETLCEIYTHGPGLKVKNDFASFAENISNSTEHGHSTSEDNSSGINTPFSNWDSCREKLVQLVDVYSTLGGELRPTAWKKLLEVVRQGLKEDAAMDLSKSSCEALVGVISNPQSQKTSKQAMSILNDLAQLFEANVTTSIFAHLLDAWRSSPNIYQVIGKKSLVENVVKRFAIPALDACSKAALDNKSLPIRGSMVRFVAKIVPDPAACNDIMIEAITKQTQSTYYLATIFIPICLNISAPSTYSRNFATSRPAASSTRSQLVEGKFWCRFVEYIMSVGDTWLKPGFAKEEENLTKNYWLIAFALQALKIIITRGKADITANAGLWNYIAHWLERVLEDGNCAFLARSTGTASNMGLERTSSNTSNNDGYGHVNRSRSNSKVSVDQQQVDELEGLLPQISVIDYALWSMAEFVTQFNTLIQLMDEFTREKLSIVRTLAAFPNVQKKKQQQQLQRKPKSKQSAGATFLTTIEKTSPESSPQTSPFMTSFPTVEEQQNQSLEGHSVESDVFSSDPNVSSSSTNYLTVPSQQQKYHKLGSAFDINNNKSGSTMTAFKQFAKNYTSLIQNSQRLNGTMLSSDVDGLFSSFPPRSPRSSHFSDAGSTRSASPSASPQKAGFRQHLGIPQEIRRYRSRTSQDDQVQFPMLVSSVKLRIKTIARIRNVMVIMDMHPLVHPSLEHLDCLDEDIQLVSPESHRLRRSDAEILRNVVLEVSSLMNELDY